MTTITNNQFSVVRYISLHLNKIQNKKFELYAISRLFHRLDDPSIKFVFQQCIYYSPSKKRKALADLYLPQFNMIIEVDEPHHLSTKEADEKRADGIREVIGPNIRIEHIPFAAEIDGKRVDLDDETINGRIDELVALIKQMKQRQLETCKFVPWSCGEDKTADYYIKKGYLSVEEGDALINVNEVLHLDDGYKNHIEHWSGFKLVTSAQDSYFWCPGLSNKDWSNILSSDGKELSEERLTDIINKKTNEVKMTAAQRNIKEVRKDLLTPHRKRITFVREKTVLGEIQLRFAGIFVIDSEKSLAAKHPVWRRIDTELPLNEQGDFSYLDK